jgi:ankyrin repeat protein
MEQLLRARADVFARDKFGCSVLHLACSSPLLYMIDAVPTAQRAKRGQARAREFAKQLNDKGTDKRESEEALEGTEGDSEQSGTTTNLTPEEYAGRRWKTNPNRMELIVVDRILNRGLFMQQKQKLIDGVDLKLRSPLMYAAKYGHMFMCSRLIYEKADVHAGNRQGKTALHYAVKSEHTTVIELLLMARANVNARDSMAETPLHQALKTKNASIVSVLLSYKADVNAYDCDGKTPLMVAMDQKRPDLFNQLLVYRPNLDALDERGWNALIYAVHNDLLPSLLTVLAPLSNEDVKAVVTLRDPTGATGLHHACELKKLDYVRTLHELDGNVLTPDCNGNTPLHVSAMVGDFDTLNLLVAATDDIDPPNHFGETPLMVACHGGHMACVVSLLSLRRHLIPADANLQDNRGLSPFMHACISGVGDLVKLFLINRDENNRNLAMVPVKINQSDEDGNTPLVLVAQNGHWHLISILVLAGANTANKDKDGWTALHWAASYGDFRSVAALLDCNAHINEVDEQGWTPLMHAVAGNYVDAAQLLVDLGSDLHIRNKANQTVFDIVHLNRRKAVAVHSVAPVSSSSPQSQPSPVSSMGVPQSRQVRKTSPMFNVDTIDKLLNVLTDGMRNQLRMLGMGMQEEVATEGSLMVTVLEGEGFVLPGRPLNKEYAVYASIQLQTQANIAVSTAFTSAALTTGKFMDWHETLRFDIKALDPGSYLVMELFAVRDQQDIRLDQREIKRERVAADDRDKANAEDSGESSQEDENQEFRRQMQNVKDAELNADEEELHAERLEQMMNMDVAERRRIEVTNCRQQVRKGLKLKIQWPPVPSNHIPLGFVLLTFRSLREATMDSSNPFTYTRHLRGSERGVIKFELDFRPKLFHIIDPARQLVEEQDNVRTPRKQDVLEFDEGPLVDFNKPLPAPKQPVKLKLPEPVKLDKNASRAVKIQQRKALAKFIVEESLRAKKFPALSLTEPGIPVAR